MDTTTTDVISLLSEALEKEQKEFENGKKNSSLFAANEYYNKLLESGVIKKRGYTLRDIGNPNMFLIKLNAQ
jgi:hypothetical protein